MKVQYYASALLTRREEIGQNLYAGKEMNESDITEVYKIMENLSKAG